MSGFVFLNKPLLHGLSKALVLIFILNCSHVFTNGSSMNSPPLPETIVLGAPKIAIHCFISMLAAIVYVDITVTAVYLVNSSTICMRDNFGCNSLVRANLLTLFDAWLKSCAFDSPKVGREPGFLSLILVIQLFTASFIKIHNSGSISILNQVLHILHRNMPKFPMNFIYLTEFLFRG